MLKVSEREPSGWNTEPPHLPLIPDGERFCRRTGRSGLAAGAVRLGPAQR